MDREKEIDDIRFSRQNEIIQLSQIIRKELHRNGMCNVTIICTHNSRRSQLAEFLFRISAFHYGLSQCCIFSGGTEATAVNYRVIRALSSFGFEFSKSDNASNPIYHYKSNKELLSKAMFSKKYDDSVNPQKSYIAVMVCDHADENCPIVHGAKDRFSLPYEDPKKSDNSPNESIVYADKVKEIGREMVLLSKLIRDQR